ncbi:hypothetical protein vseg_007961 [Gypsophila vaccaria]
MALKKRWSIDYSTSLAFPQQRRPPTGVPSTSRPAAVDNVVPDYGGVVVGVVAGDGHHAWAAQPRRPRGRVRRSRGGGGGGGGWADGGGGEEGSESGAGGNDTI